jgi:hypothetical protein
MIDLVTLPSSCIFFFDPPPKRGKISNCAILASRRGPDKNESVGGR